MPWYQILGLGVFGGMFVGGFFYALGTVLDWRDHRNWEREMEDMRDESGS